MNKFKSISANTWQNMAVLFFTFAAMGWGRFYYQLFTVVDVAIGWIMLITLSLTGLALLSFYYKDKADIREHIGKIDLVKKPRKRKTTKK